MRAVYIETNARFFIDAIIQSYTSTVVTAFKVHIGRLKNAESINTGIFISEKPIQC